MRLYVVVPWSRSLPQAAVQHRLALRELLTFLEQQNSCPLRLSSEARTDGYLYSNNGPIYSW